MKKQFLKILISIASISSLFLSPISALAYGLTTYPATDITDTSATVSGEFNIDKEDKVVETWFGYSTHDFKKNDTHTRTPEVDWTENDGPFSANLTGLQPDTTYYYRACFRRAGENCQDDNHTFHTAVKVTPPKNLTSETLLVSGNEAKLKGTWTSNGTSATVWFEYGTSASNLNFISDQEEVGGSGSITQVIGNLSLSTTYYYRFAARNSAGTSRGPIQSFKTANTSSSPISTVTNNPSVAKVITYDAGDLTDVSANLWGWSSPDVTPTKVYFRVSAMAIPPVFCNDIYGANMIGTQDIHLPTSSSFSQLIDGLTPDTTYYFCAIASSKNGIVYGEDKPNNPLVKSFTTKPCPTCSPTSLSTKPASSISNTSATLNGFVNTKTSAQLSFEYGKNNDLFTGNKKTINLPSVSPNFYGPMFFNLPGLTKNTIYRYRAVAKKPNGEVLAGNVVTFKTPLTTSVNPCPPTKPPIIYSFDLVPSALRTLAPSSNEGVNTTPEITSEQEVTWYYDPVQEGWTVQKADSEDADDSDSVEDPALEPYQSEPSIGKGIPLVGPSAPSDSRTVGGATFIHVPVLIGKPTAFTGTLPVILPVPGNPCPPENPPHGPVIPGNGTNPGGTTPPSTGTGFGTTTSPSGSPVITPAGYFSDAIVRFHEGVEHVFVRQIINTPAIAIMYGYQSTMDITQFANDLAHFLAIIFGYYENGKEIRVLPPDIAAYELKIGSDGLLMVNEWFGNRLISSRKISDVFKSQPAGYEYRFQSR